MPKRGKQDDGSINLRIDLKPPLSTKLQELKGQYNFRSYSETVRFLIQEVSNQSGFSLSEEMLGRIKWYLEYKYVKDQLILNTQDFLNKSINHYFSHIDDQKKSIKDFDIRSNLSDDELDVALAIIDKQRKSNLDQVTLTDILQKLDRRDGKAIQKILDEFVKSGILSVKRHRENLYYHC